MIVTIIEPCQHCEWENEVEAVEDGDERTWTCPECGETNTRYWEDNPFYRGWLPNVREEMKGRK